MSKETGIIPFCSLEVPQNSKSVFDWKDLYNRLLDELKEPHVEKKVSNSTSFPVPPQEIMSKPRRKSEADLRRALEQCMKYRGTGILVFDEAQHFSSVAGGDQLLRQLDVIKSLASLTKALIILIGTYDVRNFVKLSGQLARRITPVHFRRYNADDRAEREAFLRVLKSFEDALPFKAQPSLGSNWKYFYDGCLGCVGVLRDWLDRAIDIREGAS